MMPCSTEDYARFYAPEKRSHSRLDKLKAASGLMCIDW